MTDTMDRGKRSALMSRVRVRDTQPEVLVRRLIHSLGFRFRLHRKDLPGCPDIVLPRLKSVIFINGCFWHGHRRCRKGTRPSSNVEFWNRKIQGNIERDNKNLRRLKRLGWQVLVIWECQTRDEEKLAQQIDSFLSERREAVEL